MSGFWWQRPDLRHEEGRLLLAGVDLAAAADEVAEPLFLYSGARVRANLARLHAALADTAADTGADTAAHTGLAGDVFYAMKANRHAPLLEMLATAEHLGGIDACSPDEVDLALSCGVPASRISFTGVAVSNRDLDRLLVHPDLLINCDSVSMIRRLGERAGATGRAIGVRLNPALGVGYHGNERLDYAGGRTTKFGIYREQAGEAADMARRFGLRIEAVHFHVGCGFLDGELAMWQAAARAALEMLDAFPDVKLVNIGGGLGVPHVAADKPLDLGGWAQALRRIFAGRAVSLRVEPGDYLVKDAGVLLLRVVESEVKRGTRFVFVDGGFNLHPEPAFYGLPCEPVPAVLPGDARPEDWSPATVAGNINEALDLWYEDFPLPRLAEGDVLAFINAGGYGASMASNHCMRGRFAERLV